MDLSEESLHRLIECTYDAAEYPQRWHRLYEEVKRAVGVKSVHVLALDKRHGTLSYSDGANLPVEGELAYLQRYRFIDPRLPVVWGGPTGTWAHWPQADMIEHPIYQEFLLPYDRQYGSSMKLVDTAEAAVIFTTLSGAAEGPLDPAALAFLDRLVPHLQRACRLGIQNFVYSTQALVGHLLVNRLRQPVILMSPDGEVIHTNESAQVLLRSTQLVQVRDGMLEIPAAQMQELRARCAELEQSVKGAAGEDAAGAAASQFRSLRISGPGSVDPVYVFFAVLSPQGTMGTFGLRPVVMLLFYHPPSAPAIDSSLLFAVFGLTPAEARIATLLAEGLSLKHIAEVQGTQPDTVRKQLRAIYQKTSTNRQPELVRLLLHLPHNTLQR